MISKNIEKEFDISIIASFIENKVLVVVDRNSSVTIRKMILEKFEKDLLDFCSFITGEYIDYSNLSIYAPIIKNILVEQYPSLQYKILYFDECKVLNNREIIDGVNKYIKIYGEKINIKSIKKEIVKKLK